MARDRTPKAWPRIVKRTADLPPARRRWQVAYEASLTFRRRTKGGFRTKAAAQAWAVAYMTDCARGTYLAPNTERTLSQAAEEWLASRTKIKPRTHESYEGLPLGKGSRLAA